MVTIKHSNSLQTFQKNIDKHRNMLIIGEGLTDNNLNQIFYYNSADTVESTYGVSALSKAFRVAKSIGVQDIFLANVKTKTDYIEFVDVIRHYDFTYIVPISVFFSDTFFNPLVDREMTYAELYLDQIGDYSNSTIIMTDYHASLYEDLDSYLKDMFDKISLFKNVAYKARRNGRSLCLTANNLKSHDYSNVLLAAALCVGTYDKHPTANFGEAIFDIDDFDLGDTELVYFKNNFLGSTSVENLKNFRIELDAAKIITVDRVIKFIERELDFSDYLGKVFTEYLRLRLYNKLSEFFQRIVNTVIRSYTITSVDFLRTGPGEGRIINSFNIVPLGSVEGFDVMMEV